MKLEERKKKIKFDKCVSFIVSFVKATNEDLKETCEYIVNDPKFLDLDAEELYNKTERYFL